MKHILVVFNPVSGHKKFRNTELIIKETLHEEGYFTNLIFTKKNGNEEVVKEVKKTLYKKIVVVGGDGTIGDVSKILIENKIKTPLIIIPTGSANVLAQALRIPLLSPKTALLNGLKHHGKALDAIMVNQDKFGLITAGTGYDTAIMLNAKRSLKRIFGFFAYIIAILKTFFFYKSQIFKLTIDGERYQVVAKSIQAVNIIPYHHYKFIERFLPTKVLPNDGYLNVMVINFRSIWDLFKLKESRCFKGKEIVIKCKNESKFQMDGEIYKGRNMQIKIIPDAINIVFYKDIVYENKTKLK